MSISTVVKSIQDIMRQDAGVDGDAQRISQLTWMLFLKIFDDKEKEKELENENYVSPMPERLRWRNWAADDEGITGDELLDFINNDLFKTLKEMELDETSDSRAFMIRDVFMDSYNYMKSGTLIRQVANKINEIDFNNLKERHLFNDIYEKILKDLQSAGNAGEYYTPRAVTQFMADMLKVKIGETILDPACGTGGFLICAIENLRKQAQGPEDLKTIAKSISGIEKKQLPHLLCTTNMILHDIDDPMIDHDNSLARKALRDYTKQEQVEIILTNPPFGGTEEPGIEDNFPKKYRTRETADLFLLLIIQLLKKNGRAAVVLPDGFLFGEGAKTRIKERLLEKCNLHTIVRLPNGVFNPYTGIRTNLLFFEKGKSTEEIWYYEHPYPEGYKSYSKTKPMRIEEFDREKNWWTDRQESELSWKVTIDEIKENKYNLDITNPNTPDDDLGDPDELLQKYHQHDEEVKSLRDELKEILAKALGDA